MSDQPADLAVAAVRRRAAVDRAAARARWERVMSTMADKSAVDEALATVGRLTINFHPDRIARDGHVVARGLADSGRYRSQWVTGISSGMRFAFDGGDRRRWEHSLFDGAYDRADPAVVDFPLYGALDLLVDPLGGSPRFGSSYLVLADDVRARTTFTVGDSHVGPSDVGTIDEPWPVLAGLAEQAEAGGLLGRDLGVDALIGLITAGLPRRMTDRDLDHYVEAQVHGGVRLDADVTELVLDPSFRGTEIETFVSDAADRFGFELAWHVGSELAADQVPADFRGPTMPALARRVARPDGIVDAHAIGVAARAIPLGAPHPNGDPPESGLQQVKYLWHTLLALGHDAD